MRILTEEQKKSMEGKEISKDIFFNPVQDADGNWVISEEQAEYCKGAGFDEIEALSKVEGGLIQPVYDINTRPVIKK